MMLVTETMISGREMYRLSGKNINRVLEDGKDTLIKRYKDEKEAKEKFENIKEIIISKGEDAIILI